MGYRARGRRDVQVSKCHGSFASILHRRDHLLDRGPLGIKKSVSSIARECGNPFRATRLGGSLRCKPDLRTEQNMSRGMPSMTALLGLLALAGYQNRDKLAEMVRNVGAGQSKPGAGRGQHRGTEPRSDNGQTGQK